MNPMDKLNEKDIELMKYYIRAYAGKGGESIMLESLNLDYILRFWRDNKVNLYNLFGGELILTKNISIKKPRAVMEDDLDDALFNYGSDGFEFTSEFYDWTAQTFMRQDYDTYSNLRELLSYTNLSTNIYSGASFSIKDRKDKPIYINAGCKVSKMLGKLAAEFKLSGYEKFRIAHSMCLNSSNMKGEICLSIHPLDYMTMSDNACEWSSCMSWMEGGDYRQGTVEMMNSPCVIVAYLKSSEKMDLGYKVGKMWNNKRWRKLYIITPELITGIRGYPYDSDELDGVCMKWLRELTQKSETYGPYCENSVKFINHHNNFFAEVGKKIYIGLSTHYMYNDLHDSEVAFISKNIGDSLEMYFSGESECMGCGHELCHDNNVENLLLCNECQSIYRCYDCGEIISCEDYAQKGIDGEWYCEYCYDNTFDSCDYCGESDYLDNIKSIYVYHNDESTGYDTRLCGCCRGPQSAFEKEIGKIQRVEEETPWSYNIRFVVDTKDLTNDGYDFFVVDSDTAAEWQQDNAAS